MKNDVSLFFSCSIFFLQKKIGEYIYMCKYNISLRSTDDKWYIMTNSNFFQFVQK